MYIDVLFIVNFIFDYTLLIITAQCLKMTKYKLRFILSALFGATSGVLLFMANFKKPIACILFITTSVLMVLIAFGFKKNVKKILKSLLAFYIVTFLMGSVLFGILFMTKIGMKTNAAFKNGVFYMNLSNRTLLLLLGIAFILFKIIQSFVAKWLKKAPLYVPVTIYQENKKTTFFAIVDTANSLYDPFSKKPVIVAEVDCLKDVLQKETTDFIHNILADGYDAFGKPPDIKEKLHMIPFHSLGIKTGFLWGFAPQKVIVSFPRQTPTICDAVIGIYPGQLSHSDEYKALMHPALLHY